MQLATAEVAVKAIVRGLRISGTCQTTIPVEIDKGFCVHSIVPYRQTTHRRQPSRYGQHGQDVKGGLLSEGGNNPVLSVITVEWLSPYEAPT